MADETLARNGIQGVEITSIPGDPLQVRVYGTTFTDGRRDAVIVNATNTVGEGVVIHRGETTMNMLFEAICVASGEGLTNLISIGDNSAQS